MSYRITITGVNKAQAWDLITSVPNGKTFVLEEIEDEIKPPEKPSAARSKQNRKGRQTTYAGADEIVSLTGKKATAGSRREKVLDLLEQMEAKQGIGKVTRKMLRDECHKLKMDHQIIYQLLREGYMRRA